MARLTADVSLGALARYDAVIDVRSPGEFAEDHLPGAINLPVLDDAQRAEVGTLYVQTSK
ncbi:rhodanese-like domain-containing protein, partial [Klebsiella quasipneumoniae]